MDDKFSDVKDRLNRIERFLFFPHELTGSLDCLAYPEASG
jgi:hypothetical protein